MTDRDTDRKNLKQFIENNKNMLFSEIEDEIENDNITDIEWDGNHLWITELNKGCYMSEKKLSNDYIDNMTMRLSDIMHTHCNRSTPVLEANTEDLRISIWDESRAGSKSVTIRKIPKTLRYGHMELVDSSFAPDCIINLLENSTIAHMNSVLGGQPHAGKTELLKYLTQFIPAYEKAGVYEDNSEIHYKIINPDKKCSEFFVDDKYTYSDAIRYGLRHNVDWVLLSESRGREIIDLVNALSTGCFCMTTMHLDYVPDIPDRMYGMLGTSSVSDRFINNIYKYIDIGVLIECDKHEHRRLTQVGFFTRENDKNKCTMIFEDGELTGNDIPDQIIDRFEKYGIDDPFES